MTKNPKKRKMGAATKKHYKTIADELVKVFKTETFETVMSDDHLAEALAKKGIWANKSQVRQSRIYFNLPAKYERKIKLFGNK